jgi:hypothetical protein
MCESGLDHSWTLDEDNSLGLPSLSGFDATEEPGSRLAQLHVRSPAW